MIELNSLSLSYEPQGEITLYPKLTDTTQSKHGKSICNIIRGHYVFFPRTFSVYLLCSTIYAFNRFILACLTDSYYMLHQTARDVSGVERGGLPAMDSGLGASLRR